MSKRLALLLIAILLGGAALWWVLRPWPVVNDPPGAGAIVALGDSLTAGVGAGAGESYPAQLAQLLGRPVLNEGVAGETIEEAAGRVDAVLRARPAVVIVLLGGNDLLQGRNLDESFVQLGGLIARLQAGGAMVVLVGIQGLNPFGGIGKRYKTLAREAGCVYVPDILDGILGQPSLMADRIHPNGRGYGRMAERIAAALRPHLA